jgi:hypothetical protein
LFIDGLGLDLAPAQTFDMSGCLPSDPAELTLGLILRTAIAQMFLEDRLQYAPVPSTMLKKLLVALNGVEIASVEGHVIQALSSRIESPTEEELGHITAFVERHFSNLVSSFVGLDAAAPIDPRFVGAVVIRDV